MPEKKPVVGMVISVDPHPNADKIHIAKVDVGDLEPVSIIFGGKRLLKPGELVPVALPGTWLLTSEKIRPRNYRKMRSNGELLSHDELFGTTGGPDEVLVLSPQKFSVGETIIDLNKVT